MTDIDELINRLHDYSAVYDDYTDECKEAADALTRLQAENAELRKDAERFAWTVACEDNAESLYAMVMNHGPSHIGTIRHEVDAEIQRDAARQKQG